MRLQRMALAALAVLSFAAAATALTVLDQRMPAYAALGGGALFALLAVAAGRRHEAGAELEIALPRRASFWLPSRRRPSESPSRQPELLDWPQTLDGEGHAEEQRQDGRRDRDTGTQARGSRSTSGA